MPGVVLQSHTLPMRFASAMTTIRALRAALGLAVALSALVAQAQDWPTRPVKVIVPFPPGGGTDTVARPLTAKLSQLAGKSAS